MDPVGLTPFERRGRDAELEFSLCIICQNSHSSSKKEKGLRQGTVVGIQRIQESIAERAKYPDVDVIDVIDRLEKIDLQKHISEVKWHASCYSTFTNSAHIKRLQKRFQKSKTEDDYDQDCDTKHHEHSRRSTTPTLNWNQCLFCQTETAGAKVHNVMVLRVSDKILHLAQFDYKLSSKLAGISDLIAAEGKYHLKCYVQFIRKYGESSCTVEEDEQNAKQMCLNNVVDELKLGLARGEIYSLSSVWIRYTELLSEFDLDAGVYRSNKFKVTIMKQLGENNIEFVQPLDTQESLLIFPKESSARSLKRVATEVITTDRSESLTKELLIEPASFDAANLDNELLSWLFRLSVKVKADIKNTTRTKFVGRVDSQDAENVVPESLFLFLRLLCSDNIDMESDIEKKTHVRILSIAQDIVHLVTGGKVETPKHVGLGLTIHQATRSKDLVELLYAAGHSISYESVLRLDTSIACTILKRYMDNGNILIPSNFMAAKLPGYIRYANDNIDINEETLDGTGTFHASQTAAFRRKEENEAKTYIKLLRGFEKSLKVPDEFMALSDAPAGCDKREPVFNAPIEEDMFTTDPTLNEKASAQDLAWFLSRDHNRESQVIPGWSGFNQKSSVLHHQTTAIGNMPIIKFPAHEFDTIWTVINNCLAMSEKLGQKYTVITFDEQLYCKAKMLQWTRPDHCKNLILMMGGFHFQLNFAKVIGKHMEDSGLKDILIESGVYGDTTAGNILKGKGWNRVFRAHKLMFEALWIALWSRILSWADDNECEINLDSVENLRRSVVDSLTDDRDHLSEEFAKLTLECEKISRTVKLFDEEMKENPGVRLWRQYMGLVSILLRFIRATRDRHWDLYLSAVCDMLPWFAVYDHTHYTRWGLVFLADMKQLKDTAPEVYSDFIKGEFVVKEIDVRFNQIPDDQALEHCNKTGKVSGGLVGITRIESALNRWSLTYNERTRISEETRRMFGLVRDDDDDEVVHKECCSERVKRDNDDVLKIHEQLERYQVFCQPNTDDLVGLTTGDVATDDIKNDLMNAETNGKEKIKDFVKERLKAKQIDFHDPLKKKNSKTIANLYQGKERLGTERKNLKSDRELFRRVIVSMESGRDIDVNDILKKEVHDLPLALVTSSGSLRPTNKSQLMEILADGVIQKDAPEKGIKNCTIIDGMALVNSIGKPKNAQTFGDFADCFTTSIKYQLRESHRVDVLFDRYLEYSIKSGTRQKRTGKNKPIRTIIQNRDGKLPENWRSFINMDENKVDLISFLSNELSKMEVPDGKELVVSGGFEDLNKAFSSTGRDVSYLCANHEEADTRILLHSKEVKETGYDQTIILCRDTDVFVMLLVFISRLSNEVWMNAGTHKKPKFVGIHKIDISEEKRLGLLAFHALTGCDSTSQFAGISKKTAWKVFKDNPELLHNLGVEDHVNDDVLSSVEQFVCKLYQPSTKVKTVHHLRCQMFRQCKSNVDMLPPTRDALEQHIKRANYQAMVWKQCLVPQQKLPSTLLSGWEIKNDNLQPILMTMEPFNRGNVLVKVCHCKEAGDKCATRRCVCLKNTLCCTGACGCEPFWCENPLNERDD